MDENIGVENRVQCATLAVVDSDCETSRIAHTFQQQPIYGPITERRHMLRLIFQDKPQLLLVVTSVVVQKVQLDGQPREFAAHGTEGVHGENVDLDQPGKSCETGSDTPPHNSLEGVRAGIVGHDPTYLQRPKTRDRELNHLALRGEGVTARTPTSPTKGRSPLSTALTLQHHASAAAGSGSVADAGGSRLPAVVWRHSWYLALSAIIDPGHLTQNPVGIAEVELLASIDGRLRFREIPL